MLEKVINIDTFFNSPFPVHFVFSLLAGCGQVAQFLTVYFRIVNNFFEFFQSRWFVTPKIRHNTEFPDAPATFKPFSNNITTLDMGIVPINWRQGETIKNDK